MGSFLARKRLHQPLQYCRSWVTSELYFARSREVFPLRPVKSKLRLNASAPTVKASDRSNVPDFSLRSPPETWLVRFFVNGTAGDVGARR